MCAGHGRGAIEICLSEKGVLAKKRMGNTDLEQQFCSTCGFLCLYQRTTYVWPER